MKAYIINLKEAIERRNYMQKQLALLPPSLSSEFIEAVNGKEMNREENWKRILILKSSAYDMLRRFALEKLAVL